MSLEPDLRFDGKTYVAFSDLSGFKKILENADRAYTALDNLYNLSYTLFEEYTANGIKGLAVSDCVVSWIDKNDDETNKHSLHETLKFLKLLHQRMLSMGYLITTTVAWGLFKYERRIRLENYEKQMFYGKQYVKAYLANSKVERGAIVILKDGCDIKPSEISDIGKFLKVNKDPQGWEYFWSAESPKCIGLIKKERDKAKDLRFERLQAIYRGS